jgi:hypothetical protein
MPELTKRRVMQLLDRHRKDIDVRYAALRKTNALSTSFTLIMGDCLYAGQLDAEVLDNVRRRLTTAMAERLSTTPPPGMTYVILFDNVDVGQDEIDTVCILTYSPSAWHFAHRN